MRIVRTCLILSLQFATQVLACLEAMLKGRNLTVWSAVIATHQSQAYFNEPLGLGGGHGHFQKFGMVHVPFAGYLPGNTWKRKRAWESFTTGKGLKKQY